MRLLKSLEELLYELVSWIVFYPLTMWHALRHPLEAMRYSEAELGDAPEDQYSDKLSPPIFLLLTLLIAHAIELALVPAEPALPAFLADERNLLMFRALMFSLYPLTIAVTIVRVRAARLDRETLRRPFYSQCYVAAPFVLGLDIGVIIVRLGDRTGIVIGLIVAIAACFWLFTVEILWFHRKLRLSYLRASASVAFAFAVATALIICVALAIDSITS